MERNDDSGSYDVTPRRRNNTPIGGDGDSYWPGVRSYGPMSYVPNDSRSYGLTTQRRNAAVIGNPSHGGSSYSSGSQQESYEPTSYMPNDSDSYDLTSQGRNAGAIGNPPHGGSSWPSGPQQESYAPTNFIPNVGYEWTSIPVGPHSPSSYEGVFEPDQSFNEVYSGSSSGVPTGASGSNSLMEMEPTPPVSDNVTPEMEPSVFRLLRHAQAWTQAPGERWDPTSSWGYTVPPGQFSDFSSPVASLPMPLEVPPTQMPVPSATGGSSHFAATPISSDFPMVHRSDPVAISPYSRSPAELSDPLGSPTTFQCMWRNRTRGTRCNAVIAWDRPSVSRHLRDAHDFLCDGEKVVCAWDECASKPMQRRNIPRHIVSHHFEIKWECERCGLPFSRQDALRKHWPACTGVRNSEYP